MQITKEVFQMRRFMLLGTILLLLATLMVGCTATEGNDDALRSDLGDELKAHIEDILKRVELMESSIVSIQKETELLRKDLEKADVEPKLAELEEIETRIKATEKKITTEMIQTKGFQMSPGASEGYVLVSDAYGIATWRPVPSSDGGIDGEGTKNYIAKFLDKDTIIDSIIYEAGGKVGIGTTTPNEKLQIAGNVDVSFNRIKNFSGFPRPDFDSGWLSVQSSITVSHHLGGDVNNYVVDLQERIAPYPGRYDAGITNIMIGGDVRPGQVDSHYGFYYCGLDNEKISLVNFGPSGTTKELRVRIWVYD
jgi:hypothetical protein